MRPEKTVYVLGAGFSAPGGGPNQATLLKQIFLLPDTEPEVHACKESLKKFLTETLKFNQATLNEVSLEDVYTPIDRCLADGVSLRNASNADLQKVRGEMEYLISLAIDRSFKTKPETDRQYVRDFARHLVEIAQIRAKKAEGTDDATSAKKYDPLSVISLNWDIMLDKCLYKELHEQDLGRSGDYEAIGVVDYCCYISSIESDARRIRSGLWALGSRGYNVKLLKIHGSMNWLQCPNCQRLFVSFDEKIIVPNYINSRNCRHCERHEVKTKLQGSLIMPTFLKDLTNFQIKLVWQNASVELLEATKVVFIGYSLPHADFEFRQLLSRMVHPSTEIEVVLWDGSSSYNEEVKRYEQFFSGHNRSFESKGVLEYVKKLHRLPSPAAIIST